MKKHKKPEVDFVKEDQSSTAKNKKEEFANMEEGEYNCRKKGKKRKIKSKGNETDDANEKMNVQISDSHEEVFDGVIMERVEHLEMKKPEKKKHKKTKKKEKEEGSKEAGNEEESKVEIEENKGEKKRQRKDELKALNEKGKTKGDMNAGNGEEGGIVKNKKKKKKEKEKSDDTKAGAGDVQIQGRISDQSASKLEERVVNEHATNTIKLGMRSPGKNTREGPKPKRTACDIEPSEFLIPKSQCKKVKFSRQVEVFPISKGSNSDETINEADIVHGRRFTKEENAIIRKAVLDYVEAHRLGEEGINMVMNCREHPDLKGCWKEIAAALPHRPPISIYYRAHAIFNRGEKDKWTKEEIDFIKEIHAKHGADWKSVAQELGRYRVHVKDAYRRTRLPNEKKGHWSQDEYQTLFDLVNADLEAKAFEERKLKHGMLRDNIGWQAISDRHGTRTHAVCCQKWYYNLSSPMVAEGLWEDADDYRLLMALYNLDASCEEEVEWDYMIEHRPGDVCRKRWKQMVLHIGEHGAKSFSEQVEVLSKRYCPRMLEVRERFDGRPVVD